MRFRSALLSPVGVDARTVRGAVLTTREGAAVEVDVEISLLIVAGRGRSIVEAELGLRGNGFSVDDVARGMVDDVPASLEAIDDLGRATRDKRAVTAATRLSLVTLPDFAAGAFSFSLPEVIEDGLVDAAALLDVEDALRCTDCTTALRMSVTLDPNPPRLDPAADAAEERVEPGVGGVIMR